MTDIRTIPLKTIDGGEASLADYAGKVLLIVNTASQCGLTPQYTALEAVHAAYRDRGFSVLGFPANDFGAQEPGADAEIAEFCLTKFAVSFPMFSKLVATGEDKHPLYAALTRAEPEATTRDSSFAEKLAGYGIASKGPGEVLWNFEKFLVGRDGTVVGRFSPDLTPDDPFLTQAIETALEA